MTSTPRRVRIHNAQLSGEVLLAGQRVPFTAEVQGGMIDASFTQLPPGVPPSEAFGVIERFIEHYLRGGYGDPEPPR